MKSWVLDLQEAKKLIEKNNRLDIFYSVFSAKISFHFKYHLSSAFFPPGFALPSSLLPVVLLGREELDRCVR